MESNLMASDDKHIHNLTCSCGYKIVMRESTATEFGKVVCGWRLSLARESRLRRVNRRLTAWGMFSVPIIGCLGWLVISLWK